MLDTTNRTDSANPTGALLQPTTLLSAANWSWSLLDECESSVIVSLTVRRDRTNGCCEGSYLLTCEVEILRDTWAMWSCSEPLASDLASTDKAVRMNAATAISELEDDVACALDAAFRAQRMRGARNQDLPLVADAAVRS
jgi:hypothetical protein